MRNTPLQEITSVATHKSRHLSAILLLLGLIASTTAVAQTASPVEAVAVYQLRLDAEAAYAAGDHSRAASAYSELASRVPGHAGYWHRAFRAYRSMDSTSAALRHLERALEIGYWYDARWTYEAAVLHARMGDRDNAIRWAERALAAGYSGRAQLRTASAFNAFHSDPEFRRLAGIPPASLSRLELWRFDLDYFVEEAQRLHASPTGEAHSDEFLGAAEALRDRLPVLSDPQIVAGFMRLAALLSDGHSAVYGPGPDSPVRVELRELPVGFYLFSDGLYIVDSDSAWDDLVGARVRRFGPLEAGQALARLAEYRGVDNEMTLQWLGVQFYLRRFLMLEAIGALEPDGGVGPSPDAPRLNLSVTDQDGDRTVGLPASTWQMRRKLRPQAGPDTTLWLRHVDDNYWFTADAHPNAVYFQFNQVRNKARDEPTVADFAVSLAESLQASGARHLIVDLRHNNGGNNSRVRPLIRQIVGWETSHPENRIWVLTGRNTF